ncbi:gluconeogenesis factor YvcK family protein [Deinococcus arenicola]|uniref:Putative gluconeogenesis factor n=1 Tax=Deinococcus arenicola TaxID=2994950 RepID=A0ABU4DPV1_9DEIO|nr:uridine diphosphate-N-acetylglucosamine-binding protein YvcK [Deinococcus sp. ZS9-10]MDV6374129.1 uridine diphosphate-N-acetylglucosamine-binding protein YvcK [Deinococcus sp. ZS9-10]
MSDPPLRGNRPKTPASPPVRRKALRQQAVAQGQYATRRARVWLAPGIGVKRWLTLFVVCTLVGAVGFLHFTWTGPLHFVATRWILYLNGLTLPGLIPLHITGMVVMSLALMGAFFSIAMLNRSMMRGIGTMPGAAVDLIRERRTLSRGLRIVALGGGTGLSNLLTGLRAHTGHTTAIVTVSDDGGSSGRLRESLDMIAPGDLTDCYAALSDSPVMARLLLHRFTRGDGIEGHTFGNLLLATLSEEGGGLTEAMQDIHDVLRIRGQVFPATTTPATLVAHLEDGGVIRGESQFAASVGHARIRQVSLDPPDLPTLPPVLDALRDADQIVLGPGSLFTSIIPALLVPDIAHAIRGSQAPLIYVASLMTEPGETDGMSLEDHVRAITRHLGRTPDCVLVNSAALPPDVLQRYTEAGAWLLNLQGASPDLIGCAVVLPLLQPGQARHDPVVLAHALLHLTPRRQG